MKIKHPFIFAAIFSLIVLSIYFSTNFLNGTDKKEVRKIYKSVIPLRADGRYEIKGGELDWRSYNFNSEVDISGNGIKGIATDTNLPIDFPIDAAKLSVEYFENIKLGCYALYDLDANGVDEIIVQSGFGSSGLQYVILEKQNEVWKVIDGFSGSFLLTTANLISNDKKKYSSNYWYIMHWARSGNDLVQSLQAYSNGEYKEVSAQIVPNAIRELNFEGLKLDASCQ